MTHHHLIQECGFSEEELPDIGDTFRADYDIALITSDFKKTVTPIRYDYDPDQYKGGRHPASHMHLGHKNNIRIGTHRILRPLSFLFFILRQCYPDQWVGITNCDDLEHKFRNVRDHLDIIDSQYRNKLDEWEMELI